MLICAWHLSTWEAATTVVQHPGAGLVMCMWLRRHKRQLGPELVQTHC